ncbi:MAG: ADP-dependent NAD(P)H-hydrate dehydratase, partial [Flavobacteriaceae bacterium]
HTPHHKEFPRLVGPWKGDKEKLIKLKNFATSKNVVVVLKGAFSTVALPDGSFWFNSSGNPGMATAGSGDVLTGIIGSLLAQGYQPPEAAQIGVYVHGKAGDLAAQQLGQRALTASGIVDALPKAFQLLE